MGDHVVALPIERTRMRLYCLRMSDSVLIVGNGGMKSTKTYEEDESLNGYVITLQRLDKLLGQAMKSGKVTIEKTTITGIDKTEFEL
jgi:flavin-dependent dehydrogenase